MTTLKFHQRIRDALKNYILSSSEDYTPEQIQEKLDRYDAIYNDVEKKLEADKLVEIVEGLRETIDDGIQQGIDAGLWEG